MNRLGNISEWRRSEGSYTPLMVNAWILQMHKVFVYSCCGERLSKLRSSHTTWKKDKKRTRLAFTTAQIRMPLTGRFASLRWDSVLSRVIYFIHTRTTWPTSNKMFFDVPTLLITAQYVLLFREISPAVGIKERRFRPFCRSWTAGLGLGLSLDLTPLGPAVACNESLNYLG